ncbi:MAG: FAD-dependent oxidoreductase [Myxococcota bacterium]
MIRSEERIRRWARETDVLVLGLGCAGAAAALAAEAAGARVLAIERASGGGGTTALSGGVIYLGGGTPIQEKCGFEDSPEQMLRYLSASCGAGADPSRLRVYCEGSVEHFHWLVAQRVPFKASFYADTSGDPPTDDGLVFSGNEKAHPFDRIARPAPRGHVPRIEGPAGGLLMRKLLDAVAATSVEIFMDSRAISLVRDTSGAIVGAVIRSGGDQAAIRARRGVILTTGGFIENRRMVETYAPLLRRCRFRVGAEGDDGSGIRMGMAAGGAAIHMDRASVTLPIYPPKRLARGVLVNGFGQRFVNEDVYYGRLGELALLHQDGRAYLVLDEATFERPEIPREIAAVAETIDGLAVDLGLPDGSLEATLELYNRHAEHCRDPVFHKAPEYLTPLRHPPYAALDCTVEGSLYAAFTLGGLHTTIDGQVLTPDGEVIPGLYAAGRASAGVSVGGYASGLSIGDGTFFGRRAGAHAALR